MGDYSRLSEVLKKSRGIFGGCREGTGVKTHKPKYKKANERRELEDGLVKRNKVDKGVASSFSAAVCFSFFMNLEIRQQTTRNAWKTKTNIAENYFQSKLFLRENARIATTSARRSYPTVVRMVGLSRGEGGTSAGWGGLQCKVSN